MGLGGLFYRILRMFSKLAWLFAVHGPLSFLTTKYHDIFMFVWGRGTLAKAKEGQREEF